MVHFHFPCLFFIIANYSIMNSISDPILTNSWDFYD